MKKNLLKKLGLTAVAVLITAGANAQIAYFTGAMDPSNWTLFSVGANSDANIDETSSPYTIIFNGNNSSAGDPGPLYDEWTVTVPFDGCISFDYIWNNPDIEDFSYVIDGVETFVHTTGGVFTGNLVIPVLLGQTFGVRIWTFDDCCGMGVLQMDNFGLHEDLGAGVVPDTSDTVWGCGIPIDPPVGYDCEGNMVPTTGDPLVYSTAGTYTVTWTWTDFDLNVTVATIDYIIEDNEAPIPDVASLPTLSGCTVVLTPPTATDQCGGVPVTATTTDPTTYDDDGFYTVTWTYDDGLGNIATQTQDIIISNPVDASASVTHTVGGSSGAIDLTVDGPYIAPLQFDWDNDGTGDFDDPEDLTGLAGGTYTVTVMDALGCMDTDTYTVLDLLSVEELSVFFELYPNPTDGLVQVRTNTAEFIGETLFVTNTLGQVMYTTTIQDQTTELDLSLFESGIYFVSIGDNKGNIGKVIKR